VEKFEPVARSCQQLAQHLWSRNDTIDRIQDHLPALRFAPEPTADKQALFVKANPDALNAGVIHPNGTRRPPTFDHHVDVALHGRKYSGPLSHLWLSKTRPSRSSLLRQKFNPKYTHSRPSVGVTTNTRNMIIGITNIKRQQVVDELYSWFSVQTFDLLEISTLCSILLGALSRWCCWGRAHFFAIQNEIRRIL
jgi:hypothetical protein